MAERGPGNGRWQRWLIVALIALAVVGIALAAPAAYRLARGHPRRPLPPRQTDVSLIAGWMTVPYVARTFHVPPEVIFHALGVSPAGHERASLNDLAAETGRSPDEVVATVRSTVASFQATHPPPGSPPGAATPLPGGGR